MTRQKELYPKFDIKDRHNSRRTAYRATSEKREGRGKGNWGDLMDFGGERVPINEPFFDDMVEMSPPVAEENKIKLVSDKLEVPLL